MEVKKVNFIFLIIILFFLEASPAFAGEPIEGYQVSNNFNEERVQKVLEIMKTSSNIKPIQPQWVLELKEKAKKGDADSQVELGEIYFYGSDYRESGVLRDDFEAFNWFKQAAEQGSPKGQVELALMYQEGLEVRQDYSQALKWLQAAARQNYVLAQVRIGMMYELGEGISKNYTIAKEWYGKACDNRDQRGCLFYKMLNEKSR